MAAASQQSGLPSPSKLNLCRDEEGNMTTLPDPRSRTISPANDSGMASPTQHPDLNDEVATLSNKLINAINYQTNLDDTLSQTRQELEAAKERVRILERENLEHVHLVAGGILIKKALADSEKASLNAKLAEEKRQRAIVEEEKKHIEQELESLSVALFEEANKMVITAKEEAKKDHDIVQKKNDQLKAQIADMEGLLRLQQDQLAELKQVMEQMAEEQDDQTNPTAPSTPGISKFTSQENSSDDAEPLHNSVPEPVSPTYPTSFTHLLQTVLRTDLSSYDDFTSLLRMSKNVPPGSRNSGSGYSNIGLGLGLGGYSASMIQPHTNGSTSSLSTAGTLGSSPATPTTPASSTSTGPVNGPTASTPLKETKFYKRALAEDIEPTLRLDTAPGLSWLARRTVLNSVCEGTLVVEPMPLSKKEYTFACSLCGEARKDTAHVRSHRFRTSENENAQRYPLCKYCLGRVRSTCDYLGFLRILKEGHWRCEDEESERAAWEESVRLREQMFWCRMGGGVVPVHQGQIDPRSPRISEDERKEQETKLSEELERTGEIRPRDVTPVSPLPRVDGNTPKRSSVTKRFSKLNDTDQKPVALEEIVEKNAKAPIVEIIPAEDEDTKENVTTPEDLEEVPMQDEKTKRDSTSSLEAASVEGEKEEGKRLSITIPGSFD